MMKTIGVSVVFVIIYCFSEAQEVFYYPEGGIENGKPAQIICYFKSKPLGTVYWYHDSQRMTDECYVLPHAESILSEVSNCSRAERGEATYNFIINETNINRDSYRWKCILDVNEAQLNISIYEPVGNTTCSTDVESTDIDRGSSFTVTCETSCAYPYHQIIWCFEEGSSVKCSDEPGYHEDYFESSPDITEESESCDMIGILQNYVSTFKATVQGNKRRGVEVNMYVKIGEQTFEVRDGDENIKILFCAGCWAIWLIVLVVLIIALVLLLLFIGGFKYYQISKRNENTVN